MSEIPEVYYRAIVTSPTGVDYELGADIRGMNVKKYEQQALSSIRIDRLGRKPNDGRTYRVEIFTMTDSYEVGYND